MPFNRWKSISLLLLYYSVSSWIPPHLFSYSNLDNEDNTSFAYFSQTQVGFHI